METAVEMIKEDSVEIGNFILQLRLQRKLSQRTLAGLAGISNATVSRIEAGSVSPDAETLINLASALQINKSELFEIAGFIDKQMSRSKGFRVPVLGRVPAGIPIEAIEEIIDYEELPADMATRGCYFGLQIVGNSMEPRIQEGDVVIVRRQEDVESGSIAVVMVENENATIKKLIKHDNGISLMPFNQSYIPMFFTWQEVENLPVKVIGQVVELRGKF